MRNNKLPLITVLLIASCLIGCEKTHRDIWYGRSSDLDIANTIPQRTDVTNKRTVQLFKALDQAGIIVLSAGQDYRVIIPSKSVFYYKSPRLMWDSFDKVNLVVDYLKQFRLVDVQVDVYSRGANRKQAAALSYARARAMTDYLWSQSIDARMMYTRAHSMENAPRNFSDSEKSKLSIDIHELVEITFRNTMV